MDGNALNSYDDLISALQNGGEVSFDMPARNKRTLKKCLDRLIRLHRIFVTDSWYRDTYILFYGAYCAFLQILVTIGKPELSRAVTAYQVARKQIKTIKGEDIPGDRIRVTYVGYA